MMAFFKLKNKKNVFKIKTKKKKTITRSFEMNFFK